MRIVRPLGLVAALLVAATLVAPAAAADPPLRLTEHITDKAGALTPSGRSSVESAIDRLYNDRKIRLWVVFVPSFDPMPTASWARSTMHTSGFGDHDALLAVATVQRAYAFEVPKGAGVSSSEVDNVRHNQIEPALHRDDWSGAAAAAANGLNPGHHHGGGFGWVPLPIALGVVALALVVLWLVLRRQRKRRRFSSS
jgi:uncharacterized membrane protein YgcG